jgi:hypothetical protein
MSIESQWNNFLQCVYLEKHINLPEFQHSELKDTYYAGALSIFLEIDNIANTDLKKFTKGLLDIRNEVLDHWENRTKEVKTENK